MQTPMTNKHNGISYLDAQVQQVDRQPLGVDPVQPPVLLVLEVLARVPRADPEAELLRQVALAGEKPMTEDTTLP